ncbi:cytochrome c oxidase assembly protein [Actinoplanes sp. NEAU-H7]|uniref:Cytochrome c oxidase assembly protein n=2 Tax=Actinoplanes flavus TaxID=2820290 RepID=A0ABS3UIY9_9ACTN|nr:cytochrome c oxidase assembly protein [Actinoplanes flavus]
MPGGGSLEVLDGLLLIAALTYAAGILAARRRGRSWPAARAACWYAGLTVAAAASAGPAAAHGFVPHMAGHLLLGMAAPLLLVLAAPGTLALRALPVRRARRLSRAFSAWPVRILTHPAVAVVLAAGGLWLLYTTGLYPAMMHSPAIHLLVQAHVLGAGVLLTHAIVGVDPMTHRATPRVRAAALLVFMAAHGILAKYLYGHPPAGVSGPAGRTGAELMYYGGDLADLALVIVFCWQWYDPARFRVGARRPPRPWTLHDDARIGRLERIDAPQPGNQRP